MVESQSLTTYVGEPQSLTAYLNQLDDFARWEKQKKKEDFRFAVIFNAKYEAQKQGRPFDEEAYFQNVLRKRGIRMEEPEQVSKHLFLSPSLSLHTSLQGPPTPSSSTRTLIKLISPRLPHLAHRQGSTQTKA